MAASLKRLAGPAALPDTAADFYTSPGGTKTTIRDWLVCNETGAQRLLTVSIGADGAGKRIYRAFPIPGNATLQLTGSAVLEAGEKIQAYCDTPTALTLTVNGVQET